MPDPETGESINASHLIPRSRDDLFKRHAALEVCAEHSVGLMGRTPDYMNVTFAGFAARPDEWSLGGNEQGAENLIAFQKALRRDDLSLTHTIIHPTVDKAQGDVPKPGNDVALHKVGETEHGIIVRGSRILATLSPFADEMAVYPAFPLGEGADAYALAFSIPMTTPGMKILCRDSFSQPKHAYDHPLSGRFDEQDAFVIFDDVEVPKDRVFIDANLTTYNSVMRTSWSPNIMQQTMIRAQTKLEFAWGIANRMLKCINDAKTKDDLLILVFHDEMLTVVERAYEAVPDDDRLVDQAITFFETLVAYHERDLPLAQALMRQLGNVSSAVQRSMVGDLMLTLLRRLAQLVDAAKARGEVAAGSPLHVSARMLFAIYYFHLGKMLSGYINRAQFDRDLRNDLELLLTGLG